ncbi:MAG TPA: radical SAM protein [Bacteroidales bacterium]|nr:radical SAM protein [Bacteroidales bacterium]
MNNNKRVFVIDPPSQCPLRSLDASKIRNYFSINNVHVSDSIDNVDYIVYVTCSVSPQDVVNSKKTIQELEQHKARLIVAGCMPGANPDELQEIYDGPAIATKNIAEIDKFFPDFRIKFDETPEAHSYNFAEMDETIFYTKHDYYSCGELLRHYGLTESFYRRLRRLKDYRAFIKANAGYNYTDKCFIITGTGCANNCSYCNIRRAVGKVRSKSPEKLMLEYTGLLENGYRIFHFLADDISSYGIDVKTSLNKLIEKLSAIDERHNVKWSLHGMNPAWLVKNRDFLLPYIKSKKIWDITIAMESGSDKIIRLMNRHYKAAEVAETLQMFRKANPALRMDALFFAGFPTETDEDFMQTIKFAKKIKFDNARITYYYEFDYLPAAKLSPKVAPEVTQQRIDMMEKLFSKQKIDAFYKPPKRKLKKKQ